MKLPQSRKERIQVFVLAGMGLAAMLFAVFSLLNSQRARLRRNALEAAQISESLAQAEKEVHAMVLAVDDYKKLQAEIGAAVSNDFKNSRAGWWPFITIAPLSCKSGSGCQPLSRASL